MVIWHTEDMIKGFRKDNRFGFEEAAYLLMCGKMPTKSELEEFKYTISGIREMPLYFTEDMIMKSPSQDIMNKLASATLNLYSYDDNPDDTSIQNIMRQGLSLFAKFPIIVAHAYQAKRRYYDSTSMHLHLPDKNISAAECILTLIRPGGEYTYEEARLLDICLVIHADHGGGNNSTFAALVASSSGTDTYSVIASAVGCLKGPKHGGANLKVIQMFDNIKENVSNIDDKQEVYEYLISLLLGFSHIFHAVLEQKKVVSRSS